MQPRSALDGEQEIGLGQQPAQFRDDGFVTLADLRNHHVELVDAGGDQAGENDVGIDAADAYAEVLKMGEG